MAYGRFGGRHLHQNRSVQTAGRLETGRRGGKRTGWGVSVTGRQPGVYAVISDWVLGDGLPQGSSNFKKVKLLF
jgi:hypothetical protein